MSFYPSPLEAYQWAVFLNRRVPEVEIIIQASAEYSYKYAKDVIKGRWLEAESSIRQVPGYLFDYVRDVIKGRWIEGEDYIRGTGYWNMYLSLISQRYTPTDETKLRWIQEEGLTDNLLEILLNMINGIEVQEVLLQRRPDLIRKIIRLDPKLKEKYCHEYAVAGMDI